MTGKEWADSIVSEYVQVIKAFWREDTLVGYLTFCLPGDVQDVPAALDMLNRDGIVFVAKDDWQKLKRAAKVQA